MPTDNGNGSILIATLGVRQSLQAAKTTAGTRQVMIDISVLVNGEELLVEINMLDEEVSVGDVVFVYNVNRSVSAVN